MPETAIDTHAHVHVARLAADLLGVLERARAASLDAIISVGTNPAENPRVVEMAEREPMLYAAVGYHPHGAAEIKAVDWPLLEGLTSRPRVGAWRGTPHYAILFTSALIGGSLFMDLTLFIKSASAMKILLFGFGIVALILLRESRVATYQPKFRSPLYPWLHAAGIAAYVFLLIELGSLPLLVAGAILGCGVVWYALYAKTRVARESALTHLAQRIASRTFAGHDLEAELAEIIHDRDGGIEDRFDRLVGECVVLDLPGTGLYGEGAVSRDDLFRAVAEKLARRLDMPPAEVLRLLGEREELSSTVIRPGLAIPHIVVEGTGRFDILLARVREGTAFLPDAAPVHAVFVLIGSADERNYHLRALAAVAEIAQDPHFDRRWRRAKTPEDLRQLILHSKRRRLQDE